MNDKPANQNRKKARGPKRADQGRRAPAASGGDGARPPSAAESRAVGEQNLEVELAVYRQALDHARADMQAFAYSVSHDLRAPLRAMQGFSKILLEDFGGQLEGEAKQFLRHIVQNTQTLAGQLDDLLRFSRAGKHSPAKIELNPQKLVREAVAQIENDTQVKMPVEISELPTVFADPVLLRQVFVELLANAQKFSAGRPKPRITVSGRTDANAATLAIADNGAGFDPAHAGKLFQVFQKLHSPGEFPGNGIGLAIVKRIVSAHGGCVEARAIEGGGACFTIALPQARRLVPLDCAPPAPGKKSLGQNSA